MGITIAYLLQKLIFQKSIPLADILPSEPTGPKIPLSERPKNPCHQDNSFVDKFVLQKEFSKEEDEPEVSLQRYLYNTASFVNYIMIFTYYILFVVESVIDSTKLKLLFFLH